MTGPELAIAYFGNRYADHARADLSEIAALGATTVCHTFSEADLRWNPENMAELVRIGRDAGLSAGSRPGRLEEFSAAKRRAMPSWSTPGKPSTTTWGT